MAGARKFHERGEGVELGPGDLQLAGGDDYELCFTAPVHQREMVHAAAWESNTPVTRIGRITEAQGLVVMDPEGQPITRRFASFDHFA